MSQTFPLQSSFRRGMVRDYPRDQMPANTAWDIKDMIPDLNGEPLAKRGGWSYSSPSLSSIAGSATGMYGVYAAPFNGGDRLLAFSVTGYIVDVSSATSAASISASDDLYVYSAPAFFNNRIVYPTTSGLRHWAGTGSTSSVSLAPSNPAMVATYRASVAAGNAGGFLNRIYFSKPGDYSVWDTTNGFIETPGTILGLAALQSVMLVFTTSGIHRVRGAPPPYTGSTAQVSPDLTLDTIFNQSSSLTRSFVVVDERCYFATQAGLYVTDGAGVSDLTEDSGFSRYWRDAFATMNPRSSLDQIVVGAYRHYILCSALYAYIGTPTDGGIGTLVYDTINKCWFRITNLLASMYSTSTATGETYFSLRNSPRLGKLSTVFAPTSTVKEDADGTDITPTLETMYYQFRPRGTKRFKNLYVNYDLRDAASDNPTLAVGYSTTPEDTSYTSVGTLSETSEFTRQRMPLRFSGQGLALQITQTGNSSATRIYDLEADAHAREPSRL